MYNLFIFKIWLNQTHYFFQWKSVLLTLTTEELNLLPFGFVKVYIDYERITYIFL
jgi:hypothetical protein